GEVASFDDDEAGAAAPQVEGGRHHPVDSADAAAEEQGGLSHVGGDYQCLGEQPVDVDALGTLLEERITTRAHEYRVDDEVREVAELGSQGHGGSHGAAGEHPPLDRTHIEVGQHGGDLGVEEVGGRHVGGGDSRSVLGGEGGDGAGP